MQKDYLLGQYPSRLFMTWAGKSNRVSAGKDRHFNHLFLDSNGPEPEFVWKMLPGRYQPLVVLDAKVTQINQIELRFQMPEPVKLAVRILQKELEGCTVAERSLILAELSDLMQRSTQGVN